MKKISLKKHKAISLLSVLVMILIFSVATGFFIKTAQKRLEETKQKVHSNEFSTLAIPKLQYLSNQLRVQLIGCLSDQASTEDQAILDCVQSDGERLGLSEFERAEISCVGEFSNGNYLPRCTKNSNNLPKRFHLTFMKLQDSQMKTLRVHLSLHQPELRNFSLLYTSIGEDLRQLNWTAGETGLVGLFWNPDVLSSLETDGLVAPSVYFMGDTNLEALITNLSPSDPRDPEGCQSNPNQAQCRPSIGSQSEIKLEIEKGVIYNSQPPHLGNLRSSFDSEYQKAIHTIDIPNHGELYLGLSKEDGCQLLYRTSREDEWSSLALRSGDRISVKADKTIFEGDPNEAQIEVCEDIGVVAKEIELRVSVPELIAGGKRMSFFAENIYISEKAKELYPTDSNSPRTFEEIISSGHSLSPSQDSFDTSAAYLIALDSLEISSVIYKNSDGISLGGLKTGPILAPQPPQIGVSTESSQSGFTDRESVGSEAFVNSSTPFLTQMIQVDNASLQLSFEGIYFDHSSQKVLAAADRTLRPGGDH